MVKTFIKIKYRQRKYKFAPEDISKVYKSCKRKTPLIPRY